VPFLVKHRYALFFIGLLTTWQTSAGERVDLPPPLSPYIEAAQTAPEARPAEALSVHEPIYFMLGDGSAFNARFQLSFKYRFFDDQSDAAKLLPVIRGLYFGYTQTSLWNLDRDSKPFEDTSYRPSLFWMHDSGGRGLLPSSWRLGYEHESNGRSGSASRSIDSLFLQPRWEVALHQRRLTFEPKLHAYLDISDNRSIPDYRGYTDWIVRYGREDSWVWRGLLRYGMKGHVTAQLEASYPIRRPLLTRTGAFLYMQLLHGYGHTLLKYDQREDLRVRFGIAVVR